MPGRPKRSLKTRSKQHQRKVTKRRKQRRKIKSRKTHG